jgi:hypothetical protein
MVVFEPRPLKGRGFFIYGRFHVKTESETRHSLLNERYHSLRVCIPG